MDIKIFIYFLLYLISGILIFKSFKYFKLGRRLNDSVLLSVSFEFIAAGIYIICYANFLLG